MSNFIVSARKYRPQRFDEVVGQQHVSLTLKNALQSDHLAHAFLFCGPRGVGKTTCARILAKTLNCQQPTADFEPCNNCDSCTAFSKNASFNITELDAASNNSVEHIRALIEQVRFQPQQGKYKIFIIDEVHMLSQAAFNAFLKTLEEPPPYAIFILATTEKHKIIPTILSRCQIFDFKRIQVPDMVEHLAQICEEEGIKADPDALHIIGQKADGALRDALSIFDRIVSFAGKQISYEDVITNLNVLDYDYFFRVVDALLTEDLAQTLLIFDDIQRKGFDGDLFMTGLAAHLRNLLVCQDPQTLQLLDTSDSLRARYQEQAGLCSADFVLTALNLANECDLHYRHARNKRLHVELSLVKMASIGRAFRLAEASANSSGTEKKTADASNVTKADPPAPASTQVPTNTVASDTEPQTSVEPLAAPAPLAKITPSAQETEATASTDDDAPPPPAEETGQADQVSASNGSSLPKANLKSLMAQIKAETTVGGGKVTELDLDTVTAAWNRYAEQATRDTVRLQLQQAALTVDALTITARVSSVFGESTIREESAFVDYLRTELQAPKLILRIEVDKSLRPAESKVERPKILSAKDKYLAMRDRNPAVEELRKRFDLRPDE
jgi:DNA polymerase-3 subunit gamma/tau